MAWTKEQRLAWQREHRAKTNNADIKKYEKTPNGFVMRLYRNMKSRIYGVQYMKAHLYESKNLLPKDDFYTWAKESPEFWKLFEAYEASGWDRKLAPSPDRIDPSKGYFVGNMEWVTMSENSRRGAVSRHKNNENPIT